MAGPVMVRPLSEDENRELLRVVRGVGRQDAVRLRRALIVRASANGNAAPRIARVLGADADHVRDVIHAFNAHGMTALDPHWGPGPQRRISPADEAYIVQLATTRPKKVGQPFTHWSLRKLADYLRDNPVRVIRLGRPYAPTIVDDRDGRPTLSSGAEQTVETRSRRPWWVAL